MRTPTKNGHFVVPIHAIKSEILNVVSERQLTLVDLLQLNRNLELSS